MEFWVLIVAAVVNFSLAFVILSRATRASSTAYFGISALFIAIWSLGTLFMLFGASRETAALGLVTFLIAPMVTTLYMVLFSKYFSGIDLAGRYISVGLYTAILLVFAIVTLTQVPSSDVIVAVNGAAGNELNFQHTWFWFYGGYFSLMFVIAYTYLLAGMLRSRGKAHQQLRLVLIGIFLASFPALITNVVLPAIGVTDLLWLGPTWTIFYIAATCYAMVKHGLFDLRLALVLTFTYVLSLAALATLYYIIALTLSLIFLNNGMAAEFSGLNVAIALILAFLFQPIRRFFDRFTSRIFYQDNYNIDDFFSDFNRTLTSTNDLQTLLERVAEKIAQTMKSVDVSFVVYLGEDRSVQVGTGKYSHVSHKESRWLDHYLGVLATEPKVLNMLDEEDAQLRRMMISHRLAIILPLVRQGATTGYLFLGEHKRSNYSARDIRVVRTFADELMIAIQNALSVEQIKELNTHLEQRINAATRELRASNAQLQRLDEAKDEFISMASHQLRTPLTSIKGYISMLMEGDVGKVTPEQKHLLREAFISSERMVRLIGDFLNVSRLQTGKFVIEKHPVDLALLVHRELEALDPNASARGLKFSYVKPKNIPKLNLDENKIQQVVMNFADNAIYYSKEASTIKVSLKKVKNAIEFTVKDSGIGVPVEQQDQLFNKFFRATNARLQRPDGTGVGLFLAKKVIDAHHGDIIFESKENKGSTFGFRLPIEKLRAD